MPGLILSHHLSTSALVYDLSLVNVKMGETCSFENLPI